MLIVVVIIGILAGILIPRLQSTQERTRDAARTTSIRDISSAINVYAQDHWGQFPRDIFRKAREAAGITSTTSSDSSLTSIEKDNTQDLSLVPSVKATNTVIISTTDSIKDDLLPYLKAMPSDPHPTKWVGALEDWSCYVWWDSFWYTTDKDGKMFAITANAEAKRGNSDKCNWSVYWENSFWFQTIGQWLITQQKPTDESCFDFSNGSITNYLDSCPTDIIIPEAINGIKVTWIWLNAFLNKGVTSSSIPNSVTSLWYYAFWWNKLKKITIPNSIVIIWHMAFYNNELTEITIPSSVTTIGNGAFQLNKLTKINIPSSVTTIYNNAFRNNWPNRNSYDITGFEPNKDQTRILNWRTWVKQ